MVELLVVIAIIGTLATLLLLQLGVARAKARDAKRIADINQLRSAIELYFDDNNGSYPDDITIGNLQDYLSAPSVPTDPLTGNGYFYAIDPPTSPVRFHLYAELEGSNNGLRGDSDINSTGWVGDPRDASLAATEACASDTEIDCVYDTGQQ